MDITASERKAIATQVGADEQYLYQCMTGRRRMDPADAVRIERESSLRIRRWHLRPLDWHHIWPELVGSEGAPEAPVAREAA